jgi:plasmid stabilization system protein ParE
MRYRFSEEALAEYISAGCYYESCVPGLGVDFADEVEKAIQEILTDPSRWRIVRSGVRRYLAHRFPYGVYFTVEDDLVVIWSIRHLHRRPKYE